MSDARQSPADSVPDGQEELSATDPIIRQRERTVDNVKRLYAIIFSLSFTNFVREIFDTAKDRLSHDIPIAGALATQIAMLLIFYLTAAVFFFHIDRYLDIRYAMLVPGSMTRDGQRLRVIAWRPQTFAFDYLALVLTMIPFMFMSFTMDPEITKRFGILPFFVTYILLFLLSGLLLLPYSIIRGVAPAALKFPGSETARYAALSTHWLILNSTVVLILLCVFRLCDNGDPLASQASFAIDFTTANAKFVIFFVLAAVIRDVIDFRTVWPFLYLSRMGVGPGDRHWGLRLLLDDRLALRWNWFEKLALYAFGASALAAFLQLYSVLGR